MRREVVVDPAGLELPRLRCYLFFSHEDPTKPMKCRVDAWCLDDLRELWYEMDKDYSRAASRVAISQLTDEINILREPPRAKQRFRLLVSSQDMAEPLRENAVEEGREETLEHRFEQILRFSMMKSCEYIS